MNKSILKPVLCVFASIIIFLSPQDAFAHDGDPRIEINPDRLNPGSVIEIRGVNFESEEEAVLSLTGSQVEVTLGTAIADVEGVFLLTISLPADLPEGTYTIRATLSDTHIVESPQITVWGTAVENREDNGIQDQSDVQFDPIPTLAADAPTPVLSSPSTQSSRPPEKTSLPLAWIALGIGAILLLGMFVRMKMKQ